VRLVDPTGVARARASPAMNESVLEVEAWSNGGGEVVLHVLASRPHLAVPVRVELDAATGIPTDGQQPPHGAVRYKLFRRDNADKTPTQFKMQWVYDVEQLRKQVSGENADAAVIPNSRLERALQPARDDSRSPWVALGRVTDVEGKPLPGVEVRAHCGMGSLRMTGNTTTDADGRYELRFGPGIFMPKENKVQLQAATISVHRPGYFEKNLHRQGDRLAAYTLEGVEFPVWGKKDKDAVFLPGEPKEINFVMLPAAKASGTLVDEDGKPLTGYRMSLTGDELPPSSSALASGGKTDENGRFEFRDIPTGYRFQILIEPPKAEPPWLAWASVPLEFRDPAKGDLAAMHRRGELIANRFEIQLAGPGVNWREALKQGKASDQLHYSSEKAGEERDGERVRVEAATLRLLLTAPADQQPEPANEAAEQSTPALSEELKAYRTSIDPP
jgi:hypothetical protein